MAYASAHRRAFWQQTLLPLQHWRQRPRACGDAPPARTGGQGVLPAAGCRGICTGVQMQVSPLCGRLTCQRLLDGVCMPPPAAGRLCHRRVEGGKGRCLNRGTCCSLAKGAYAGRQSGTAPASTIALCGSHAARRRDGAGASVRAPYAPRVSRVAPGPKGCRFGAGRGDGRVDGQPWCLAGAAMGDCARICMIPDS